MTKAEMVEKLAETWGGISNRQAADNLDSFVEFIRTTVKKDKVLRIPNLGTFQLRSVKRRKARNPRTGEEITIPARNKVAFKPAKSLTDSVQRAARKKVAKKAAPKKAAKKAARKRK